jgi:WD40 repeat protein
MSHDGTLLAGGIDVELPVWSTSHMTQPPQKLYIGRNVATSVDFSRDGRFLIATLQPLDGTLSSAMIFSLESRQTIGPFGRGERGALFHPTEDDIIVTAGDEGVRLWSLSKHKLLRNLLKEPAVALAVDRDNGRLAASLADGDIAVWDTGEGRPPVRSGRRVGKEATLAFISGADALLWVSDRGLEIWYWLEDTWLKIADTSHRGAAVLRDGSVLGVNGEGQALVYNLKPALWLDQTCKLVGRNLTRREWKAFIGEAFPYECVCPEYEPGEGWSKSACQSGGNSSRTASVPTGLARD